MIPALVTLPRSTRCVGKMAQSNLAFNGYSYKHQNTDEHPPKCPSKRFENDNVFGRYNPELGRTYGTNDLSPYEMAKRCRLRRNIAVGIVSAFCITLILVSVLYKMSLPRRAHTKETPRHINVEEQDDSPIDHENERQGYSDLSRINDERSMYEFSVPKITSEELAILKEAFKDTDFNIDALSNSSLPLFLPKKNEETSTDNTIQNKNDIKKENSRHAEGKFFSINALDINDENQ